VAWTLIGLSSSHPSLRRLEARFASDFRCEMKIFNLFRGPKPRLAPVPTVDLQALGIATWSEDDDSWEGCFNGISYFIGFDPSSPRPLPELAAYARSVLTTEWLEAAVATQKSRYLSAHPAHSAELKDLRIESLHFYLRNGARHIDCQLGYGSPDRFWSLDFKDGECTGLGFDT
jgi:hypothetical protein